MLPHFFLLGGTKSRTHSSGLGSFSSEALISGKPHKPTDSACRSPFSREAEPTPPLGAEDQAALVGARERRGCGYLEFCGVVVGDAVSVQAAAAAPHGVRAASPSYGKHKGQESHQGQLPTALLWGTRAEL